MGKIKLFQEFHNLSETNFPRIARAIKGNVESISSIGIMSAENPMGEKASKEYNDYMQSKLKSVLREKNYGFHEVLGKYGNYENSIIIPNISKNLMMHLCQQFNQESVIWGERVDDKTIKFYFINNDGAIADTVEEVFLGIDAQSREDFYTWVKGRKFYIPFFEKVEKEEETKEYKKFNKPNVYSRQMKNPKEIFYFGDDY
jgi:hypothetical protein